MKPERIAELVARWVRLYTRDVPVPTAERRIAEIDADLYDHITQERSNGISDGVIARAIVSRMLRGLAADLSWRGRQAKLIPRPSTQEETMKPRYRSAARVALGVALILSLPLVAMLFTDEVVWSLSDFVIAGVLLTVIGVGLELAVKRAGNLPAAIGMAILGVAAAILGELDDAPGLVLVGIVLIASACAMAVRRAQRSSPERS